jgi:hypothetical protein
MLRAPGVTMLPLVPRTFGSLLAPERAVQTSALTGYARVSTSGQLPGRQQRGPGRGGPRPWRRQQAAGQDL